MEGKEQNCFFFQEKSVIIHNRLGLHLRILLKHLLISLYPFPVVGRVLSKWPPGVNAFVGGTCELLLSKVMGCHSPD